MLDYYACCYTIVIADGIGKVWAEWFRMLGNVLLILEKVDDCIFVSMMNMIASRDCSNLPKQVQYERVIVASKSMTSG